MDTTQLYSSQHPAAPQSLNISSHLPYEPTPSALPTAGACIPGPHVDSSLICSSLTLGMYDRGVPRPSPPSPTRSVLPPPASCIFPGQRYADAGPQMGDDESLGGACLGGWRDNVKQEEGDDIEPAVGTPAATNFITTLYRLLEDESLSHIIHWGKRSDVFVIQDVNAFTIDVIPRNFKHSNFASFVRQLNKYDFHKGLVPSGYSDPGAPLISTADGSNNHGPNSWAFRHPDFRAGRPDILQNIRRKGPHSMKRSPRQKQPTLPPLTLSDIAALDKLQAQVERMSRDQNKMIAHIQNIETEYVSVVDGIVNLQKSLQCQDETMRQLVEYALQHQNGGILQ
ncbi:hypothetical protein NM688_g112 [Phlebia brevispora]|uniref:Uncharacterized protein n=1 Tax=Phlebia brevispora TaxID=194682 RepID=A0ACC1TF91_9APHY|nr:hypothetical protein NM688_g112 [Phlebia brevispora]